MNKIECAKKSLCEMIREGDADISALPYDRFEKYGEKALTDAELLAIIIRTGTKEMTPVEIGRRILDMSHDKELGLACLYHLTLNDLTDINGIGKVKAIKLKCIAEISRRMALSVHSQKLQFDDCDKIASYYMEQLRHEEYEKVLLLSLNTHLELLEETLISVGSVNC